MEEGTITDATQHALQKVGILKTFSVFPLNINIPNKHIITTTYFFILFSFIMIFSYPIVCYQAENISNKFSA